MGDLCSVARLSVKKIVILGFRGCGFAVHGTQDVPIFDVLMLLCVVANRGVWLARLFAHKWVAGTKERMPSYALLLAFSMSRYSNGQRKAYERTLSVETVTSYNILQ